MVLVYPKAHKQVFYSELPVWQWAGESVIAWSLHFIAHNLFIPNGPLNICFMFEFLSLFYFHIITK